MFGRKKEDPGPVIEARAIVTEVRDTGATVNMNPRVEMRLRVEPDGAEPWETVKKATVSRINIPRVGDPLRVKYFQNAPDGLAIQRRTGEDLAAAEAAHAGGQSAPDSLDELKKLNELRLAGALSDQEFEAQKAKILA
ncbi:MAG TPA: SHOCT domain-containing protein [Solirubrobacteraceae bacterium]|jgi:hypothetical protein|nr:SHOCT domain-containing protein [Solirubrobacteraceae bacterium]